LFFYFSFLCCSFFYLLLLFFPPDLMCVAKVLWVVALQMCVGAPVSDLVLRLPGMTEPLRSKTYSGLIPVPARTYDYPWGDAGTSPAVHAHYWYSESEQDPNKDPVILWLQGGPGGSSLGGGFYEMGPFRLDDRSYMTAEHNMTGVPTPLRNDWSWTTFAGLILLEYADIGFSRCDSRGGLRKRCQWDIGSATEAIVGFLIEFFKLFPERRGRPFWVAGESFAGNLVTTVASALDSQNSNSTGVTLAGVLHGNGAVGDYQGAPDLMGDLDNNGPPFNTGDMGPLDVQGHVDFWWRSGLTSTKLYQSAMRACPSLGKLPPDTACRSILKEMQKCVGNFQEMGTGAGWWNVYNIYDTCTDMPHLRGNDRIKPPSRTQWDLGSGETAEHSVSWMCGGMRAIADYFNRANVQNAIHVGRTSDWEPNDSGIRWNHPKEGISFLGEIKRLAQKYPFLAYSGDADAQIPHTSTEAWTSSLGFAEVVPYQMWTLNKYVQGYATRYQHSFTFATVKGAGHMVPLYRPAAAHAMVSRFVATQEIIAPEQVAREEGTMSV